jgi:hypothetical protein
MFHTVYKTTNLQNSKFYIGCHKTDDPNDAYLGSGKYLKNAVAKYGIGGFRKDVLFVYSDAKAAFQKEAELVDAHVSDPLCMNLKKGGEGGFDWINATIPSRLNLVGMTFGKLSVLGFAGIRPFPSSPSGQSTWLVQCACGKKMTVLGTSLISGKTISCGSGVCRGIVLDLVGKRFGKLVVVAFKGIGRHRNSAWLCKCDCGAEKVVIRKSLLSGDAKSCGKGTCHPKHPKISIGQRFGRLVVVARSENSSGKRSQWVVQCDCGSSRKVVLGASLRKLATKSCGCIRKETTAKLAKTRTAGVSSL